MYVFVSVVLRPGPMSYIFSSAVITVMFLDSCVSGLSIYRRVQWGGVSQRGWGECQ